MINAKMYISRELLKRRKTIEDYLQKKTFKSQVIIIEKWQAPKIVLSYKDKTETIENLDLYRMDFILKKAQAITMAIKAYYKEDFIY